MKLSIILLLNITVERIIDAALIKTIRETLGCNYPMSKISLNVYTQASNNEGNYVTHLQYKEAYEEFDLNDNTFDAYIASGNFKGIANKITVAASIAEQCVQLAIQSTKAEDGTYTSVSASLKFNVDTFCKLWEEAGFPADFQ